MGKVCFSYDILLITDNDRATQDDKSPPPCMQLQAGVGFFLPMQTHPPPRLQLRDGVLQDRVGFFHYFLSQQMKITTSHVGSSLISASICTQDSDDKPHRLVIALSASTTTTACHVG